MIRIEIKDCDDVPDALKRNGAFRKINQACLNEDGNVFNGHYYRHENVLNKLKAFSVHKDKLESGDKPKCFYCESYVEHVAKLQVEHYRPKAKVDNIDNNGIDHGGYYWLGLEWTNLLLSCPGCNGKEAKGNRFPLSHHSNRAAPLNPVNLGPPPTYDRNNCKSESDTLLNEKPILLNPEIDHPENHLTFDEFGQILGIDERGKKTVEILNLKRDPLLAARQEKINALLGDIKSACEARFKDKIDASSFLVWLESSCKKVLDLDNVVNSYCLWGKHVISNFEKCIVSRIDPEYQNQLRKAFEIAKNNR